MALISIADIMSIMKKYYKSGILICIICVLVGFIYGKYAIPTTYINTSKFYVDTKENVEKSKLDLEYIVAAQQLVATYIEIFKSDKVLNEVKDSVSYDYTKEQLSNMITCDSINHTAIMKVDVISNDANAAYEINKQLLKYGEEEANRVIGNNRMIIIDEPNHTINPIASNKKIYICASIIFAVGLWIAYILLLESKLYITKVGDK